MKFVAGLIALVVLVAGCASAGPAPEAVAGAWRTAPLTDVRTGESFTIADLQGKLVVIETMAIWCVNCHVQQAQVAQVFLSGAYADVAYLSLDVDPSENPADLARYADEAGYPWVFAVAARDFARSLADEFGDQILSPPATPSVVIGPDGIFIESDFGIRSADDLAALFDRYRP